MELAEVGERIRIMAPQTRRVFGRRRLEALYEMAFIKVFIGWERFIEDALARMLCGYVLPSGPPLLVNPPLGTVSLARQALLGTHNYVA